MKRLFLSQVWVNLCFDSFTHVYNISWLSHPSLIFLPRPLSPHVPFSHSYLSVFMIYWASPRLCGPGVGTLLWSLVGSQMKTMAAHPPESISNPYIVQQGSHAPCEALPNAWLTVDWPSLVQAQCRQPPPLWDPNCMGKVQKAFHSPRFPVF